MTEENTTEPSPVLTGDQLTSAKQQMADRFGIPEHHAARLKGQTLEELEADAAELSQYFPDLRAERIPNEPSGGLDPHGVDDRFDANAYAVAMRRGYYYAG